MDGLGCVLLRIRGPLTFQRISGGIQTFAVRTRCTVNVEKRELDKCHVGVNPTVGGPQDTWGREKFGTN